MKRHHRTRLLGPVLITFSMGACTADPVLVDTSDPDDSTVTLSLQNPTAADPLQNVTTFRLEVLVDNEIIASHDFDDLSSMPSVSHLYEYGSVRFQVAGIGGGEVLSLGRSAEIIIEPAEDLIVPVTFLPVNQVLALDAAMVKPRAHHASVRMLDGRTVILGGFNPDRNASFNDFEVYDPATLEFQPLGAYLEIPTGDPTILPTPEGDLLIVSGRIFNDRGAFGSDQVTLYQPTTDTASLATTLSLPRMNHCAGQYLPTGVLVLGGPNTTTTADIVRRADDGESWTDMEVILRDGLVSDDVTGCLADTDGRIFVQGVNAGSTGIWDPEQGIISPGDAFTPITESAAGDFKYVRNALIKRLSDGVFWIAGGVDMTSSQVLGGGREFRMSSMSFVTSGSLKKPRNRPVWDDWLEEGWVVVGCGYSDPAETIGETLVEILNPATSSRAPDIYLDRERPGCQLDTQLDGTVLFTGGFAASSDPEAASAAILVPYFTE